MTSENPFQPKLFYDFISLHHHSLVQEVSSYRNDGVELLTSFILIRKLIFS